MGWQKWTGWLASASATSHFCGLGFGSWAAVVVELFAFGVFEGSAVVVVEPVLELFLLLLLRLLRRLLLPFR